MGRRLQGHIGGPKGYPDRSYSDTVDAVVAHYRLRERLKFEMAGPEKALAEIQLLDFFILPKDRFRTNLIAALGAKGRFVGLLEETKGFRQLAGSLLGTFARVCLRIGSLELRDKLAVGKSFDVSPGHTDEQTPEFR